MIAVDTNVLLRYLVLDDELQARSATALLKDAAERQEQIYVSAVVLAEVVWVLTTNYELGKAELLATLHSIVRAAHATPESIALEHAGAVRRAVEDYASGRAGFVDYLIGRIAEAAGATTTYTFDRAASAAPTFARLQHR